MTVGADEIIVNIHETQGVDNTSGSEVILAADIGYDILHRNAVRTEALHIQRNRPEAPIHPRALSRAPGRLSAKPCRCPGKYINMAQNSSVCAATSKKNRSPAKLTQRQNPGRCCSSFKIKTYPIFYCVLYR